ncbi:DUF3857 domain-containing protein [Paludibaculum fermentans]|uniref:DUF3857 domain-containing protein n=1 Tax=Paludibaculum fermentans TaxID=1473598 RepID=UPI003EB92FD3
MPRFVVLFLIATGTAFGQTVPGDAPWTVPFSKDTTRSVAAAKAVSAPDGADAIVLLDEQRYLIDPQGRTTAILRKVYRVLTTDGVEDWSSLEQEYAPWYQRRPELRARVLTADGASHWLDSKTASEAPAQEFGSNVLSDRRVLRAPLPAVASGSLVEFEIVVRENAPLFEAGAVHRISVWDSISIQRFHLVIDAAPGASFRFSSQMFPKDTIRSSETKSGVHVDCDWGPIPVRKEWESSLPFDVASQPVFEFSTGRSWQEVAARYSTVVDGRIGTAGPGSPLDPPKSGETPLAIAARLTALLHKQVRYTGLELADAAIVPAAPSDVLARRYGDCKDKATLLVSMLRASGLKANVVLLSSGTGLDVNPELPGLGQFNHAIVYVDGPQPFWIDATAQYTRVGDLPTQDQGRLALIATPSSTTLVKTPESTSSENRSIHRIEIRLPEFGKSVITESIEGYGSAESELRARYGDSEPSKVKETLEAQVKQVFLAEKLGDYSATRGDDFTQPFNLKVTMNNAGRGATDEDQAAAGLFSHFVFASLPYGLAPTGAANAGSEKEIARVHDFVLPQAYQCDYHYRITYPSFLTIKSLPANETLKLGTATFSSSYTNDATGSVEAVFRFDTGRRRLTPAEYAAMRTELRRMWKETPVVIQFTSATSDALALGKVAEAARLAREYALARPSSSVAQAKWARILVAAGAGEAAIAAGRKAAELDPKSSHAWQALGWAYQHDSFGRRFRGNWNPSAAEESHRKAIETAEDKLVPQIDLAIVLEHNADGERYGPGARVAEAVQLYRTALEKGPNAVIHQNLVIALIYSGKYPEAGAEIKSLPSGGLKPTLSIMQSALAHGSDRALLDAQNELPDSAARSTAIAGAAASLSLLRRYDLATELLKAARRINNSPELETRLSTTARLKRYDENRYPHDDPRSVVWQFYLKLFAGRAELADIRPLLTKLEVLGPEAGQAQLELLRMLAALRGRFRSLGFSREGVIDLIMSSLDFEKHGEDTLGYRVSGSASAIPISSTYVVKEEGQYKILATASSLENVGKLVLNLLKANDLGSARRWLDLAINGQYTPAGQPPSGRTVEVLVRGPNNSDSPAARYLWAGVNSPGLEALKIRVTAASLIGTYSVSDEAIGILRQARAGAKDSLDRGNIDLALCQAYAKSSKWAELLKSAKDLSTSYPVADKSFPFVVKARTGLKQWTDLELDAVAALKKSPDDSTALRAAVLATLRAGKPDQANAYIEKLRKLEFSSADDHFSIAWSSLLAGKPDAQAIELVQKDLKPGDLQPDNSYVLGFLQMQANRADEARSSLTGALEVEDWAQLDARPWILQGKLQWEYGNREVSESAFAEARKKGVRNDELGWILTLIPSDRKQ